MIDDVMDTGQPTMICQQITERQVDVLASAHRDRPSAHTVFPSPAPSASAVTFDLTIPFASRIPDGHGVMVMEGDGQSTAPSCPLLASPGGEQSDQSKDKSSDHSFSARSREESKPSPADRIRSIAAYRSCRRGEWKCNRRRLVESFMTMEGEASLLPIQSRSGYLHI